MVTRIEVLEQTKDMVQFAVYAESCVKDERKLPAFVEVRQCARCGQDHPAMEFTPLWNPPDDMTHFAICPVSKQPILMNMVFTEAEFAPEGISMDEFLEAGGS